MLGKLGRLIKSKKHPVATLVQRYRMNVATSYFASCLAPDIASEDDALNASHPLLNVVALNSFADPRLIDWPLTTRNNTIRSSDSVRMGLTDEQALQFLSPLLGVAVVASFVDKSPTFQLAHLRTRVQVGRFRFSCKQREDLKQVGITRESFFSVLAQHVPAMVECYAHNDDWNPDAILYGRILHFVRIDVPEWRPQPFLLAEAVVHRGCVEEEVPAAARLPFFRLQPIEFPQGVDRFKLIQPADVEPLARGVIRSTPICHLQVQHIRSMIGVAPKKGENACYALEF